MRKPFDGEYPVSQTFGNDLIRDGKHYYEQWGMKGHNGIDYAMPSGTVIKSPINGMVKEASFDPNGYGNYVKIESETEGCVLAHLDKVSVSVRFEVKEGDVIGTSDNTGYSTGPHLHFGYYKIPRDRTNGFDGYIDQQPFLVNTEAQNQPPVSGKLYTEAEYQAAMDDRNKFWKERDIALGELKTLQEKYDSEHATLTAFKALGYNSVDDVIKMKEGYETTNAGLNKQLVQVLDRNKVLAELVAKKDDEDYTAIQLGLKAIDEAKKLKEDMTKIRSLTGIGSGDIWHLLSHIQNLKDAAIKAFQKGKKEAAAVPETKSVPVVTETAGEVSSMKLNVKKFLTVAGLAVLVLGPILGFEYLIYSEVTATRHEIQMERYARETLAMPTIVETPEATPSPTLRQRVVVPPAASAPGQIAK